MELDNFVAINIIVKDKENFSKIVNEYPIIFYWNGESDMVEDFITDESFTVLVQKVYQTGLYENAFIRIEFVNGKDLKYNETSYAVQDLFPLEKITDIITGNFKFNYIKDIFLSLYKIALKEEYKSEYPLESQVIIKDLYDRIKNGITKPVSKETIVNYIREQLIEKTYLSKENINYLISLLEYIIKESN